jgi:predicted NAD/FAD-binding protein
VTPTLAHTAVIGAGSSGLTAGKMLEDYGRVGRERTGTRSLWARSATV